jgi:hypothetical protein
MKALTTLFAAGLLFANAAGATGTTSQVGSSAAGATVAAAPAAVQSVTISKTRSRAEVRAEAVEALKNHKTTLARQLDQYQ